MTYSFIFMEFSAFRIHSLRFFSDQKLNYAGEYGKRNEEWNEKARGRMEMIVYFIRMRERKVENKT